MKLDDLCDEVAILQQGNARVHRLKNRLLLVVRGRSAWWACDINQCAYTEDVVRDSTTVVAVNGRALQKPVKQSGTRRTKRSR